MAELNLARWYYPPGRPVEEGRIFDDPSKVPAGWGVDPTPPKDPSDPVAIVSPEDYEAAVSTAQSLMQKLADADAKIAELEAALAAASKPKGKGKASAAEAPADPDPAAE